MGSVASFAAATEERERRHWDAMARAQGFADYESLALWCDADFDRRFTLAQSRCTHADKHPDLGMCEECAAAL